jgi:hypothetical protein
MKGAYDQPELTVCEGPVEELVRREARFAKVAAGFLSCREAKSGASFHPDNYHRAAGRTKITGQMDGRLDGRTDRQTDGQTDRRVLLLLAHRASDYKAFQPCG